MSDVTPESAGWVIDDIRRRNGGVSDEDRAATPAGVLQALDTLREDLFYRITTIRNPGSKLIVHLISRTSLLAYDRAEARGENGYLGFTLAKDHLMIDSNDNGYCGEAVTELCRYPFSETCPLFTQQQVLGAFQIGTKIHIQSGPFSFSFQYTQGNNMMDKLTPNREQSESLPSNVYSRITISCLHPGQFERLANDFRGLRTNGFLLFDSKCTVLRFKVDPPDANYAQVQYQITKQKGRMTMTRTSEPFPFKQSYYMFSKEVGSSCRFAKVKCNEIYLAFPIDQEAKVLLSPGGYLNIDGKCALLPGDDQINFIICVSHQCSFCQVCEVPPNFLATFLCEKMVFLSTQEPMQYEWVQYIPKADLVGEKWKAMLNHLYNHLKVCRIYKSESGKRMHLSSLRYLGTEHCDQHGKPLFPDLDQELYLSTRYNPYLEFLKPLGIRRISNDELFDRIKEYYKPETRTFKPSGKDWSARVARLLTSWLEDDNSSPLATKIKDLRFTSLFDIPVLLGVDCLANPWRAELFRRRDVWLPFDTNGNLVPALPNICRIYEHDAPNSESMRPYNLLGICCPQPQQVMEKIEAWNHSSRFDISVSESRDALLYLRANMAEGAATKVPCLPMVDEQNKKVIARGKMSQCSCELQTDVYFPSEQDHGISEIAAKVNMIPCAPRIHVLNEGLLDPTPGRRQGKPVLSTDWVSWLENAALVRRVPRLQNSQDPNRLSEIFDTIIKHYPGMLLNVLRSHWATYEMELAPGIVSTVKATPVPTLDGNRLVSECYVPTPELRVMALKVFRSTMGLPFLLLSEDPLVEEVQSRWGFLSVFGVVTEPTPEFFVGIYDQIVGKISLDDAASEFQALYSMLSKKPSHDRLAFFNARKEIYVPSGKTGHAKLVPLQHCLWNGPCWLQASYVLSYVKGYCENPQIQTMLRVILNPTEAGLETYIKELRYQQGIGMASFPQIERIYARLSEDSMDEADLTSMRDLFKRHKLVYHPNSLKWYSPQECAWALSSDDAKISIGQYYPQFRELFMARLLIEASMTRLYISKLSETVGRKASSLDELLSVMQKFNDLPLSLSDISLLNRIKFLPIVGVGQVQYYSSLRDEFFIVDRDGWPCNFRGIVPTLRFRVDQVQRIRSFLIRVGLENRFITVAGLKQTFVSEERIKGLPQLTCDFQDRAAALCRCATFYASENAKQQQELYDLFRASLIYESRDIIARCIIPTADGATKSIDTPDMLHVQYESGELQLVVPNDITQRQICFATQLPEALASLFSANSPEARGTFATILREPIDNLDGILDSYGIPELSEVFVDAEESVESETSMEEVDETLSISDSSLTDELIDLVDHMDLDTDPEDSVEPEV